jgi:hypothetical protein
VTVGEHERLTDKLLYDRARQVMILLRNNIVLNVRVQEAEARAAEAERQLAEPLNRMPRRQQRNLAQLQQEMKQA